MPPLAPPAEQKAGPRQRHADKAAAAGGLAQRSASFHGRGAAEQQRPHHHMLRQRPRTQPDLLAGVREQGGLRRAGGADAAAAPWRAGGRKEQAAPSKVLVTVTVQRSMWPLHVMATRHMWPLHVMARTEWRVADLVAAAVELYVKERRRPLLPSADPAPADFSLHYSQFSLQSLDPEAKLMELGSRSFFLCSKAALVVDASSPCSSAAETANKATASSANRPNMQVPWLGLMHFWPLL